MSGVKHDPARYRRMQEPHENSKALNENADKFFDAVDKAREEFRMAEVEIIVVGKALTDDGQEGEALMRMHLGDPLRAEGMAAFAYGTLKRDREQLTAQLLAGEPRTKRVR